MDAQEIAKQNYILEAIVGSKLHGLSIGGSDDEDRMGVCIEPPEYVIGLRHFEQWVHRSQPEGVRSQPGDLDLTIYSLRKFCRLALSGNPTILLLLFAPSKFLTMDTAIGRRLQGLAPAFIAKSVTKPLLGYMTAQRQRLLGERGQKRVKRPELEEKYGYDVKYGCHILRLGYQGCEILTTGRLTLPMMSTVRDELLAVRLGAKSLQWVLTRAGELEREIKDSVEKSPLPDVPDVERVNRFLIETYANWWTLRSSIFRPFIPGREDLLNIGTDGG